MSEQNSRRNKISVQELSLDFTDRWDEYVNESKEASFFHRAGWKRVIEDAFGHHCYFLYAEQDGDIRGILPLGYIRSILFGKALISTPFGVYGGIVAEDIQAYDALKNEACRLADSLGVDYLELRNRERPVDDWPNKELYVTFRKGLDPDPEKNLLEIPRKQRAMVRKGIKSGLTSKVEENLDTFYEIYATSVRNLGTPVFSKKYFKILKKHFSKECKILTIMNKSEVISSVLSFYHKNEVLPYYGGGTLSARKMAGNDFMYWELMRRACENGVTVFDYGRSKKGTGSYSFKKNWGFESQPLYHQYYLVKSDSIPDINPLNPKYRIFINTWKKLPLSVSKLVGPLVSRNLG